MEKTKLITILKIIGTNMVLFAILFGLISFNKLILRPGINHLAFVNFLTGSFPNFIAAYIISLMFANSVLIKKPQNGRIIVYVSSALVFVILAIEELKPMWGASTHFDTLDILGSGLGSLLASFTFELVMRIAPRLSTSEDQLELGE